MGTRFSDDDIQEIKDCIAFGIVSSINTKKITARVEIADQGIVSGDLKIIQNTPVCKTCGKDLEIWLPKVGQNVLCLFIPGGDGDGFILGGI